MSNTDEIPKIAYPDEPKTEPSVFDMFKMVQKTIDDMRQDISTQFNTIHTEIKHLKHGHRSLFEEVEKLKRQQHKDYHHASDVSLEHEAAIGGAIAHVSMLEDRVVKVEEKIDKSNEAVGVIVEELGIDAKTQLGRSIPPGTKQTSSLSKISKTNKTNIIATATATVLLIVQIVWKLLEGHR